MIGKFPFLKKRKALSFFATQNEYPLADCGVARSVRRHWTGLFKAAVFQGRFHQAALPLNFQPQLFFGGQAQHVFLELHAPRRFTAHQARFTAPNRRLVAWACCSCTRPGTVRSSQSTLRTPP